LSTSTDTATASPLDWAKWILVAAIVGGGIFANWYFQDESLLYRVVGLIVLAALALAVVVQTQKGGAAWSLIKEARSEARRVVWPKREETVQTTLIVLVLVIIFSLILWLLDSGLSLFVSAVIG